MSLTHIDSKNATFTPEETATIEANFKSIAPTLGIPQAQLDNMTIAQKSILVQQHGDKTTTGHENITPEAIIKRLESGKNKEATIIKLRTCIRSELLPWTDHFLELNGHLQLFEIFSNAFTKEKKSDKDLSLLAECCRCMKALMNTPEGLTKVLEWKQSIEMLFDSIEFVNILSQSDVLLVLAGLCFLSSEAHVRILAEIRKTNRFPHIMEWASSKNDSLATAALTFVNALIGATGDTQSRVEIRNEFLKMNLRDLVNKVPTDPADPLSVQAQCFNMGADEDLETLIKAGAISAPHGTVSSSADTDERIEKLTTQIKSLEYEVSNLKDENAKLKDENAKLKAAPPTIVHVPVAGPASETAPTGETAGAPASAPTGEATSVPAPDGSGAPPPPPPPGGADAGGPPPPPPPPGGADAGGPPPPPPPPGAGGGPPPPPPPPGAGGGPPPPPGGPGAPPPPAAPKRPAKLKCKPNKKMRAFGWNKIADAKIDNTIWEKTNDAHIKLDTLELESIFGMTDTSNAAAAAAAGGGVASPAAKLTESRKAPAVQLLDPKRANNCEIMLRGLKMEPQAIKTAILAMDDKVLTEDTLRTMKEYVPMPEEITVLKEYTGDKKQLGRAEQYFLAVMEIPKLSARLGAMAYKASFDERADLAKSEIQTLSNAITSVKNSKHLFSLLEIVLAIGNYLNGSGNNGGVYGFRINSLNKMLDVKSSDNKMTLIHYLYELVSKKHKEVLEVLNELACCAEASRLNIRENNARVAELKTGFATVEALLGDPNVDSTFSKIMAPFVASAKPTIEQLESRSSKLDPSFKECVTYYGEPPSTEPEDFFGALSNFMDSFARAKSDNEKRAAAAAKDAQSKALLAAVQAKQVTKKKGQLDDAIAGMQNGTMFHRLSMAPQPINLPPAKS